MRIDHLVYAVPDLERGVEHVERLLGVRATPGGRHLGRGTQNALLALGPRTYLEIIGPDRTQNAAPSWFRVAETIAPALVAWAVATSELEVISAMAAEAGVELGPIIEGSRTRTDGVQLRWRYTDPTHMVAEGIVPFFIDWGASPHPALTAARGATLRSLRAQHPQPELVQNMLDSLDVELPLTPAERAALIAMIDCAQGQVELR